MIDNIPVITKFKNQTLNKISVKLIQNYGKYHENSQVAKEHLKMAIVRRFINGQLIDKHYYEIVEECGSQRAFGEEIGVSEAMISNDLRAYRACAERGADTPEKLLDLLQSKNLRSTTYEWERLPKLLNEPESYREPDRRAKAEKRLEELHAEAEEIRTTLEGFNPQLAERAGDTLNYIKDIEEHIGVQDVFKSGWRSREYLDFVKSIGFDYITGQPAQQLDPHHTLIDGQSLGPHGKVADVFTIPVNRATHEKIEQGQMELTRLEIAEALIRTMALFITTNMKSD